jgi:hypothetical protein
MGLLTSARIDEEVDVEVDDDDVVAYVLGDPALMDQIRHGMELDAGEWADAFANEDAVGQEQMLAALRRVCPHMTISR